MAVKDSVALKNERSWQSLYGGVPPMHRRTPEQIEAARARLFAFSPEPRSLPPGKTLEDVIVGQLPDDDSEEEVLATLDEIS